MPGFLSLYRGTQRVHVTDTAEWWVDVKQVLLHKEMADVQLRYIGTRNLAAYQLEMITLAISDWNLTDDNGALLPLADVDARREAVAALPQPVFLRLYEVVSDLNSPRSKEEQLSFRNGDKK